MKEEKVIKRTVMQAERKTITLELIENHAGRALRVCEAAGGKRNWIMIPATGLPDLSILVAEMVDTQG